MAAPPKNQTRRPPKPGPNYYWNGRDWVWIQKIPKPSKAGGSRPRTTPPKSAQTMEEWATAQAEKRVQAEVDAIRAQQGIYEKEMQDNAQRQIDQAKSLAAYIQSQGFDKRIQGIYSAAGSDLAGIASGFAGDTRDIASADAAAQMNMLSGTGQEGAVRNQGTNMGDVLYGVGGWIPSKSLGEQGAAYAADAAMQPAFTLQYGQEQAAAGLREGQAGLSDFAKAIAEAQAGKYSYKEELLTQRRKASLDQQKMRVDQLENDRDFWLSRQALLLSQKKYKLAAQAEKRAAQVARRINYETQGRDYEGNPMPGFTVGRSGNLIPPDYHEDRQGNVVKNKTSSASGSKYTPTQQASMIETIVGKEEDIQAEIMKAIRKHEWNPGSRGASGASRARAALGRRLYKQYAHLAGTYKPAQQRLHALIRRLLNEAAAAGPLGTAEQDVSDDFWRP